MLRLLTGIIIITAFAARLGAQAPPTQLFVFDLQANDTSVVLTNPRYLTAFNAEGYNNHPNWADNDALYASIKTPEMAEPDVYLFDLNDNTRTRLTQTAAGEYSPKPRGQRGRFSAVRQEVNGQDTVLRLWEFPVDRSDNGQPVLSTTAGVGYYAWLNNVQLALFMVGAPNELVLASSNGDAPRTLARSPGRTFQRLRNGNLVYVDKSVTPWQLVEQNLYRQEEAPITVAEVPEGTEDFVVLPDGSYLTGVGSKLYRLPTGATQWRQVVDLTYYGLRDITRLSLSDRGRLAVVAEL